MDNDNHHLQKTRATPYVVIAMVAALGVLGVVVVLAVVAIPAAQEAEAAKSVTGQCASTIKNSSAPFCPKP